MVESNVGIIVSARADNTPAAKAVSKSVFIAKDGVNAPMRRTVRKTDIDSKLGFSWEGRHQEVFYAHSQFLHPGLKVWFPINGLVHCGTFKR